MKYSEKLTGIILNIQAADIDIDENIKNTIRKVSVAWLVITTKSNG